MHACGATRQPRRLSGAEKAVLAIVYFGGATTAIVVMLVSGLWSPVQSRSPSSNMIGAVVNLREYDNSLRHVSVSGSLQTQAKIIRTARAGNRHGFYSLFEFGLAWSTPCGTSCRILDAHTVEGVEVFEVEILEGPMTGSSGYVTAKSIANHSSST